MPHDVLRARVEALRLIRYGCNSAMAGFLKDMFGFFF